MRLAAGLVIVLAAAWSALTKYENADLVILRPEVTLLMVASGADHHLGAALVGLVAVGVLFLGLIGRKLSRPVTTSAAWFLQGVAVLVGIAFAVSGVLDV